MTEQTPDAAGGGGQESLSVPRQALILLAVALTAACLFLVTAKALFPDVLPSSWTAAEKAEDRQVAVTAAARKVTLAFLDVDYRDMDPQVENVLDLSTGAFKEQYEASRVELVAQARDGEATSKGEVKSVGISDIDEDSAVVFVAADSTVDNKVMREERAKGEKPDGKRFYRFELKMTRVGDSWLLNELEFVS